MSRRDWSETTRTCSGCGRKVSLTSDGKYPRHFGRSPTGRRQQCLRSGLNALTLDDLGRSTKRLT